VTRTKAFTAAAHATSVGFLLPVSPAITLRLPPDAQESKNRRTGDAGATGVSLGAGDPQGRT